MSTETLYDQGNRYTHLSSAGTTVIRSTATRLVRVNVNTITGSSSVQLYNGVSVAGDLIANINTTNAANTGTLEYNLTLSGGLTVVVTNAPDVTIIYR